MATPTSRLAGGGQGETDEEEASNEALHRQQELFLVVDATLGPDAAGRPEAAADPRRLLELWNECLAASGGPFLFGEFGIADAFFAPVLMLVRTYALPLDATCETYADRLVATAGVAAWIEGALAEHDFRPFEEPYRDSPTG